MKAKAKTDTLAGKQKRPTCVIAREGFLPFGGGFPSIRELCAGPDDRGSESEEQWPSVPRFTLSELTEANTLAQLAIQICTLKKEINHDIWETDKRRLSEKKSTRPEEQIQLNREWQEKLDERQRLLNPSFFLEEARSLLEQALAQMKRPMSASEFLCQNFDDEGAIGKAITHSDRERRVPFKKIFDPGKKDGETEDIFIPMADGSTKLFRWRVFISEKGFDECFWGYADMRSKEWREKEGQKFEPIKKWVQGQEVPEGFPPLTEVIYGSKKKRRDAAEKWVPEGNLEGFPDGAFAAFDSEEKRRDAAEKWICGHALPQGFPPYAKDDSVARRAKIAREKWGMDFLAPSLEQDLISYNRSWWISHFREWIRYGIPWEPFIKLYDYRKRSNPKKGENLRGKRGPGRKSKSPKA